MEQLVEQKHANFVAYVRETLASMNIAVDNEVDDFLKKPAIELISQLKLLLSCMPYDGIVIVTVINLFFFQIHDNFTTKVRFAPLRLT